MDDDIETHIQTTYDLSKYKQFLKKSNLTVIKAKTLDERIILVCQKGSN